METKTKKYKCSRCDSILEVDASVTCFECPVCHKVFYVDTSATKKTNPVNKPNKASKPQKGIDVPTKEKNVTRPLKTTKESDLVKKSYNVVFKSK